MLYFENDYCEGAHPAILQKLAETNFEKVPGYGTDPYCASAKAKICAACGCPDADVTFISGGTQTNAIVIASMLQRCSMDAMTMALVWVPPEMKVTSASGQPQAAQIFALALAQ